MHRTLRSSLVVVAAATLFAVSSVAALAQDARDFDFINTSSAEVDGAWIVPSGGADWGEQVLSTTIDPGETRGIRFSGSGGCEYDLHVTAAGGGSWELLGLDLCTTFTVELSETHITAR